MEEIRRKTGEEPGLLEIRGELEAMDNEHERYRLFNGLVFKKNPKTRKGWVMIIPERCRDSVLTFFHDEQGHLGWWKLMKMLRRFVFWKGMNRDAKTFAMNHYIKEEGRPQKIVSDHGTQFDNARWRKALNDAGVRVNYTSIRHPQSNASQRYIRVIGDLLRIRCFGHHNGWVDQLKEIEKHVNHIFSGVTGYIPEDVQRERCVELPFETNKISQCLHQMERPRRKG